LPSNADHTDSRREFFKSLGRNLILGLTGAGVAVMFRNGQICLKEYEPCNQCSLLKNGCQLPKAVSFRKQEDHATN
jgi:hypothetical protein